MFSIPFVILCVYFVIRSTEGAEKHLRWKHAIAISFLLLCFGGVVAELGWISGHPNQANRIVDLANAPIPPTISVLFFVGRLAFELVTVVLSYFLSRGNNYARLWLLRILPILFLITAFEVFASFNRETAGRDAAAGIGIALLVTGIPYLLIRRLYSNSKVIAGLRFAATHTPD